MKVKLYFGILSILLLSVTLFLPLLARAEPLPLQWSRVEVPGTNSNVIVSPSEVSEIAIGSGIYYALDTPNSKIYRTRNGGLTWENISPYLMQAGALMPATRLAVAPDNSSFVSVVTNAGTRVYLSIDGGINWVNANVPPITGTIQTITISPSYNENDVSCRDVAIGTAVWGDGFTTGQVWLLKLGVTFPSWQNLKLRVDPDFVGGEVSAIAFSPSYADNQTLVVVASTNIDVAATYRNKTFLCIGQPGTTFWNDTSNYPNYPVEIVDEGDATGASQITCGLALPGGYSSASASLRKLFTFFYRPLSANNGVYRIENDMSPTSPLLEKDVSSISLSGSKLLVGLSERMAIDDFHVPIYLTSNAFDLSPAWQFATQPPSGPGNAKVAWSSDGKTAFCGTGQNPSFPLDESAFSVSMDDGDTWQQISLIDTQLVLTDAAVASSPASLFIASTSPAGIESVWRSAGEPLGKYWGRVLTIDVSSNKLIIRLSPNYQSDYTVYLAEVDNPPNPNDKLIWVSNDRGNSWRQRRAPQEVVDMAVADKNTVYVALSNTTVAKSTTGAKSWQDLIPTCLPQINMLYLADAEALFVGGKEGDVAYSTDGGKSFSQTPQIGTHDDVQAVADANYSQSGIIYASSGNGIYRLAVGADVNWQAMKTLDADRKISGIVLADGVLYAVWYTTAGLGSGAERCLEPTLPTFILEWSTLQTGSETARFDATPASLRFTSTSVENKLWAIDSLNSTLMVYSDCLAKRGPVISGPELVGCDPVTGRNQEINLTWEQLCLATRYDILIAKDSNFTQLVLNQPNYTPAQVLSPVMVVPPAENSFECGHTYYWMARVSGSALEPDILSPWSEVKSFQIKVGLPVTTTYVGPMILAPVNGATGVPIKNTTFSWTTFKETSEYYLQLSETPDMLKIIADVKVPTTAYTYDGTLKYNTNYYWQVRANKPAVSDWSPVFSFITEEAEPSPVTSMPSEVQPVTGESEVFVPFYLVVLMVGIGLVLSIALIILTLRARR